MRKVCLTTGGPGSCVVKGIEKVNQTRASAGVARGPHTPVPAPEYRYEVPVAASTISAEVKDAVGGTTVWLGCW